MSLARLEYEWLFMEQISTNEYGVLDLNQSSKSALVVFYEVLTANLLDVGMDSRYRDVITYPYIARGISSNLQVCFVLCIENEEHLGPSKLLFLLTRTECFQDYEVFSGSLNVDNVNDTIVDIH